MTAWMRETERPTPRTRLWSRSVSADAQHALGELRLLLRGRARGPERVLLILGCQRSGTTLMTELLSRDPEAKVYPEQSSLSANDPRQLRLAPTPEVRRRLQASRFPLVALKPLVESQHADRLLDELPGARALWMLRHYADVARSNLARFGVRNGIRNLALLLSGGSREWRAERVPDEVRERIARSFSADMNPWDAAALFWWARNSLFFARGLDARSDVLVCRYEELVARPGDVMPGIYRFLDRPFPGDALLEGISPASLGSGAELDFHPEVRECCEALLERLDSARRSQPCG